ncbi:MAG: helix-turn-helix domain-containing protein [Emergencia sp.]
MGGLSKEILNVVVDEQEKQGISTIDLSKKVGCSVRAMEYWANGKRNISLAMAEKTLEVLGFELKVCKKVRKKEVR